MTAKMSRSGQSGLRNVFIPDFKTDNKQKVTDEGEARDENYTYMAVCTNQK